MTQNRKPDFCLSVLLAKNPNISTPRFWVKHPNGPVIYSTQPGGVPKPNSLGLGSKKAP